ncbi:helix-turn-helix domain-containing protein [Gottschalkia purinilytica]|uniref:Helix-turn-helix domain-containing protein n=1 Tax=Gottschalkia purinilytica TaxID=1503 RepID=A0A0L0W9U6_GOTPU|nr:helix-turn-helix transcriptional regulator [Gottschalkia purinilytica]KNF08217.1 helix-turn-helix domain-containing protein [Gottschalkia purinilytica]
MEDVNILSPGKRLRQIRKMLKLGQETLAGDKFSKNYISMFENDKRAINAINAGYLANRINTLAKKTGENIEIDSSYLLKSNIDIAKDKCQGWLSEVDNNLSLDIRKIYENLYKVIILSSEYDLIKYRARALYLKGKYSLLNSRYECAITQFLEALIYYGQENDYNGISEIYKSIGKVYYLQKEYKQALIYFNLSDSILEKSKLVDSSKRNEIKYYRALCYHDMDDDAMAKRIIKDVNMENLKVMELAEKVNNIFAI